MSIVGRETAPILFTGAAVFVPMPPSSVNHQSMALSMHLFVVSTQVQNVPEAIPYGTALVQARSTLLT